LARRGGPQATLLLAFAWSVTDLNSPNAPPHQPSAIPSGSHATGADVPGLHIHGVGKWIGQRQILKDVSFSVHRGEVAGLLGPNGAGKTTCFYIITGLLKPDSGLIYLDGNDLTGMPMYRRARMGISYLAQEASIFRGMSVEQNLMSVAELHGRPADEAHDLVNALLEEFGISRLRRAPAVSLSGGERRRVEIARALATEPSFLLMDEPFAGLDPIAVDDIREVLLQLRSRGLGILITDHNVKETLGIVDVASVIYDGSVLLEGAPQEILSDPEVRRVYLGDAYAESLDPDSPDTLASAAASRPRGAFKPPAAASIPLPGKGLNLSLSTILGGALAVGLVGLTLFLAATQLKPADSASQGAEAAARYDAAIQTLDAAPWKPVELKWKNLPAGDDAGLMPVTFAMPLTQYGYGGESEPLPAAMVSQDTIVRVDVGAVDGAVGVSLVNPSGSPLVTKEQGLTAVSSDQAVFFRISPAHLPAAVLLRNYGDTSGNPASIRITGVSSAPVSAFSKAQLAAIADIGLNGPRP
jgi:lipopolysaccharide export system ATP-binding protein